MFIAVLKIRQVQGSVFFALGHVFSPPPTRLDLTMQKSRSQPLPKCAHIVPK
jgi:hypothetical protein